VLPKPKRLAFLAFIILMLASPSLFPGTFVPSVKAGLLYDSGDPTAAEQLVLEYINRARADPVAEGHRLGIDIHEGLANPSLVGPRPPLAMNKILLSIAQAHSQEMYNLNYFSHNDPNGTTPFGRMAHADYDYVLAGENMAGGTGLSATELEDLMMVDAGTAGRPHRVNLLDLIEPYPCGDPPCAYDEVGIGYYEQPTLNRIGLGSLITEDFGATGNTGPYLLGVVYNDMNNNDFYDIGEGIAGVTITTSNGIYYAVSSTAGGYAIPIATSGTITVTASGPKFGPVTKTLTLNGTNVKVDFTQQASWSLATTTIASSTSVTKSSTSTSFSTTMETTTPQNSQITTSRSTTSMSSASNSTSSTSVRVETTSNAVTSYSSSIHVPTMTAQVTTNSIETSSQVASDFSIRAEPNPVNIPQASSIGITLTVESIGAFNLPVTLSAGNLPPGVEVSFPSNPISPPPGGTATATVTVTATRSISTGTYTFTLAGSAPTETKRVSVTLQVSGCLIATATFGSELAPEVQFLRNFRDYKILQTFAGSSFMVAFNDWYYSFSPAVAQFEYGHPLVRAAMKDVLYPVIAILQLGAAAFDLLPMNPEAGALLSGLTISALLGILCLGLPLTVISARLPFRNREIIRRLERYTVVQLAAALSVMALSDLLRMEGPMIWATAIVVLSAIAASAVWTQRGIKLIIHLLHFGAG
jgi:hypothetical protein